MSKYRSTFFSRCIDRWCSYDQPAPAHIVARNPEPLHPSDPTANVHNTTMIDGRVWLFCWPPGSIQMLPPRPEDPRPEGNASLPNASLGVHRPPIV